MIDHFVNKAQRNQFLILMIRDNPSDFSLIFYSFSIFVTLIIFKANLYKRFSHQMTINEIYKLHDIKERFINVLKKEKEEFSNKEKKEKLMIMIKDFIDYYH